MAMRVLVVDDEDTIRGLIVQVLEDEGYETAEAPNAEEALKLGACQVLGKPFDSDLIEALIDSVRSEMDRCVLVAGEGA